MPLTEKGDKIKSAMQEQYGKEKGEEVFYASENKGTIEGVHAKDSEEAPHPVRRPNLLGTVSNPNGIKPAERELKSQDQDMMTTTSMPTASTTTASMTSAPTTMDEDVSEKEIKSATPPMNNLSSPGNPGKNTGPVIPYSGVQVGDSLHNQNIRNRAFWARKGR
jgi:hypothetical protein